MAGNILETTSTIEGIGPATEAKLAGGGIHVVLDLLARPHQAIHTLVRDSASFEQVRAWRSMAALLQVKGMTPQWAEALVNGAIQTVGELRTKSIDALQVLFADARSSGVIPSEPAAGEIVTMLVDAASIHYTGTFSGIVTDFEGEAVAGAEVRVGQLRAVSDAAGRFHLLRIPLGRESSAVVQADGYRTHLIASPTIIRDPESVRLEALRLETSSDGPALPSVSLSEFHGDRLPVIQGTNVRTVRLEQLRDGDLLVVRRFMSREPLIEFASRFRSYIDGEFIVNTVRVPISEAPDQLAEGDHVYVRGSSFEVITIDREGIHRARVHRQSEVAFAGRAPPRSEAEWHARITEEMQFHLERAYQAPPPRSNS